MIPAAVIQFALRWWKAGVGFVLGALFCFPLAQCHGEKIGRGQMQHAIDAANVKALEQERRADALAANQRITDTIAVNHQEQELRNAIVSTPDSLPDATRIALGCERLRRANSGHPANLPAQCRPGGGAQAGPAR